MKAKKVTSHRPFDLKVFLTKVNDGGSNVDYRTDESMFVQGARADAVFYISKGNVKLTVTSKHGRKAVTAIFGPGDFFGEGCLAGQLIRTASAVAISECSITKLEKVDAVRLLHEEPSFSNLFLAHLLSRHVKIEEALVDQLFNSSEKRLAGVLLLLADFGKEGAPQTFIPKISQNTLAGIVGTTRPRINFFMNRFRNLGFIEYNGVLKIRNSLLRVVLRD